LFGTVFANSVLEHVPRVELGLAALRARLVPGGRLIATVPLEAMNEHLASQHPRYVAWRQRQLQHRNLWSKAMWERNLLAAGFAQVTWADYLSAQACRLWDRADVLATLGAGRFRAASALHHATSRVLTESARTRAKHAVGRRLLRRAAACNSGPPCAAVLCAVA
jgi:hypothetical protein